jgi:hypothetical protein
MPPPTNLTDDSRERLARLLASAAAELAEVPAGPSAWALLAVPVTVGRLHLARHQRHVSPREGRDVAVAVGFDGACWLGASGDESPPLGPLVHRTLATLDSRGRLHLDRRVRLWLAPPDPDAFGVLVLPAPAGLYVVPVDGFDRRWSACVR